MNNETRRVPEEEILRQKEIMARVRGMLPAGRKYHIVTLGCQMNVRDSETLAGMLTEMGFTEAATREEADLILYNTCCVRENAENKALGNVIWLKELKKDKPELIICVGGCMTQEEGMAESLIRQYPFIDLVFGTHNAYRFPEYLEKVLSDRVQVFEVLDTGGTICEGLPEKRSNPYFGFVNIMYGCNNFCSYCIVPYVRGRERSREMDDILGECKRLRDAGAREIMLLGPNVNSYMGGGAKFAELLYRVDALDIPRVRFMTSHPKDLSDELIAAYGELRHLMPDVIVGFPGETEAQFEDTLSLVREVRFDAAYTFIYSPRAGTRAAEMDDPVSMEEKTERIQRLIALQQSITSEVLASQIGQIQPVLVDSVSTRSEQTIGGKTPRAHMVNFPGSAERIGQTVPVRITSAGKNTLRGEAVEG